MSELWTIAKMLAWATPFLARHGSPSARLDAELLLGHALTLRRLDLYVQYDRPIEAGELADFKALVKRRAAAEPVAYILGRRAFHDIELLVGPGVLVPRPETEHLVDRAVAALCRDDAPAGAVLDVGTGSGAIALAVATALQRLGRPRAILATDVSAEALAWAARNREALGLVEQVRLARADLAGPFRAAAPLAALVSNPPYVRHVRWQTLEATVRAWEPQLALDGGDDGLDVLRRLVATAAELLAPGGLFAVELGDPTQGAAVAEALHGLGFADARYERIGPGPTGLVIAQRDGGAVRAAAASPAAS